MKVLQHPGRSTFSSEELQAEAEKKKRALVSEGHRAKQGWTEKFPNPGALWLRPLPPGGVCGSFRSGGFFPKSVPGLKTPELTCCIGTVMGQRKPQRVLHGPSAWTLHLAISSLGSCQVYKMLTKESFSPSFLPFLSSYLSFFFLISHPRKIFFCFLNKFSHSHSDVFTFRVIVSNQFR